MKLVLVENEKEVEIFYKKFGKSKEFKWIVLTPFAISELEKLNINYNIIDDYYDSEELWSTTGWNSYSVVNQLIEFCDSFIRKNAEGLENIDVLNCYRHQLVMLFDGIIGRLFMLKNLLEKLKPSRIDICKRNLEPFAGDGYLFGQNDTLWANCLSLKGWFPEINVISLDETASGDFPKEKVTWKSLLKKVAGYLKLIEEYRSLRKLGFRNYVRRVFVRKSILLVRFEYGWVDTVRMFFENGIKVKVSPIDDLRKMKPKRARSYKVSGLVDNLAKQSEYRKRFLFENIDFYPLLKPRIEGMICEGITKGSRIYSKAEDYIVSSHPEAALFSIAPHPEYWFFLQAFKSHAIPVICWQHGSEGFYDNRGFPETELLYTDYFFDYGEGVTESYSKFKNKYDFRPVAVGSSTIDKLADTEKSGDCILYATTNYYQNNLYFAYSLLSDIKLYRVQRAILNYLEKVKEETVIFKLHPVLSYRTPPVEVKSPRIRVVRNEKSFEELLKEARIIILDCPTTTLIQAAVTRKPVFVLSSFIKVKPEALDLLGKRAVCDESPEGLMKKLDNYLKTGIYPADVNNREFVKKYGIHLDDGGSARRAVNKVMEIIGQKCQSVS